MSEDLETLNPYLSTAFIVQLVTDAIFDPLAGPDQNGEYQPVLAERVPTQANGDISEDGATITWRLRPDVTWADGAPFTSKDVLFTYEAAASADSGSVRTSAFENIKSIEAPDDHTVVITYNEFDANYLDQFQWGILPAHARAVENSIYVVISGNAGNLPNRTYLLNYAQSAVFTPSDFEFPVNAIAGEAEPNVETVVITDLDLNSLAQHRELGNTRPLHDRRPDLYELRAKIPIQRINVE